MWWERDLSFSSYCYSVTKLCKTLCNPMNCNTPGFLSFTISLSLFKLMSIESVMPSNCLILCFPLLLLPSIFPIMRVFSNELNLCIRSFQWMCIQGWFPLGLTGLISSLSKGFSRVFSSISSIASVLQHSAFFMVKLSYPYLTTEKTIALPIQTFVG